LSDIIKFRQLIEIGYSILQINVDDLGQTVIEFSFADKCHPPEGQFYSFTTQDQAVIQKANEIVKNDKKTKIP
jgi:hypothetical protein